MEVPLVSVSHLQYIFIPRKGNNIEEENSGFCLFVYFGAAEHLQKARKNQNYLNIDRKNKIR